MNIKQLLIAASISIGLFPALASAAPAQVTGGTKTATLNVSATLVDPTPIAINGSISVAGPLNFGTVTLPTSGFSQPTAATTFTVTVDAGNSYQISIGAGLNDTSVSPQGFIKGRLLGGATGSLITYELFDGPSPANSPRTWPVGSSPTTYSGTGSATTYNISSIITLESGVGAGTVATLADTYSDTHTITLTY